MRFTTLAILLLAPSAFAQTFDPHMPAPVPEVTGPVMSVATVHYIDIKIGTGAPALPGKQYTVNYTGWLRSGKVFDSTYQRNQPFPFVQGRRMVIAGWELAFEGMRVGGKRRIFIPPQLAYGERGSTDGAVPPNSEMIQDIELMDVSDPPPPPTPTAPLADLLVPLHDMTEHAIALAQAVPESKYGWRPGEGVRSFSEVFLHIVYGNQLLLNVATNAPGPDALKKQIEENAQNEKQALSKERIVALLTESLAAVKKAFEDVRAQGLNREVDFFGQKMTRRAVMANLDTHIAEHLGQAIAYARMNGVTPPWSK
jgi:peptidylprolyl isomerase